MQQSFFFTTEAVAEFLKNHGKGTNTKDYEFLAAVMLKNFCEKQWNVKCLFGFEFKPEYLIRFAKAKSASLQQVAELFRKGIEENTPIDCIIIEEKVEENSPRRSASFQIKRFGIGREKKDTNELIVYINTFYKKYDKQKACLLIVLDKDTEIELPRIKQEIDISKFPFERLMFSWMSNNKICFAEIHPKCGMEEYDPMDIIN